ncbi:flagellar export protein FliJ [Magnetofaba australis]|uniref:flagellar export protein FliJ n=1 Tax=Magnetofaba australis TaxID=1472297 RepID=UPI001301CA48|nr:flagellar export protein FliJ [Magnetofaba australis]
MTNRFTRLVHLRRLREEALGGEYARTLAQVRDLHGRMHDLEEQTLQGERDARDGLSDVERPPTALIDGFARGQAFRRKRLELEINQAQAASDRARTVWLSARTQLQQAEKLSDRAENERRKEMFRKEYRELDMAGVVRHHRQGE